MPELPEVETTRNGILPFTKSHKVKNCTIRNRNLRWPIDKNLAEIITGHTVLDLRRRGKYLLFEFEKGTLIWHLGMSGSIRVLTAETATQPEKHDHIDLELSSEATLRYNDPRRFGAVLWTDEPVNEHKLIAHLGPEPLSEAFNADYLYKTSRNRKQPIKSWIMDSKIVVGVGNIYANESLFLAGVHPLKATGKLTQSQAILLTKTIKQVLTNAIKQGGTTLKDFVGADGKLGYFKQKLNVYGRGQQPCPNCEKKLTEKQIAQRTTVYCTRCQN